MTDDPKPTPEDELRDEAKTEVETPPEKVADAEALPAEVEDERVEDEPGT